MISLPRAVARQFRAVLRRSLMALGPRGPAPPVLVRTGPDGLSVTACSSECALHYRHPGALPPDSIDFPSRHLDDFDAGRGTVELEAVAFGKGRARWTDGNVPCSVEFDTTLPDRLPPCPAEPNRSIRPGNHFLRALAEACQTAARDAARFALSHLQLRGKQGQIVATDGRQLLVQGGFAIPWSEDLLVPSMPVFGCKELRGEEDVSIGSTDSHVVLTVGPWTLFLATAPKARYPEVDGVIPSTDGKVSRLQLSQEDAEFLSAALPKLPGKEDELAPVTLDLSEQVVVRARAKEAQQASEVVLSGSRGEGPSVRVALDRRYLLRLARLGFREVQVHGSSRPLVCKDDRRLYLFMPLDADAVLHPTEDAVRIPSDSRPPIPPEIQPERRIIPVASPPPDRNGIAREHDPPGVPDPIAEAEALRELLHDALGRLGRVLTVLRHQRRQSRAVQAAMQSLRRLKLDGNHTNP